MNAPHMNLPTHESPVHKSLHTTAPLPPHMNPPHTNPPHMNPDAPRVGYRPPPPGTLSSVPAPALPRGALPAVLFLEAHFLEACAPRGRHALIHFLGSARVLP
eukprot:365929-Chlamydomonas_euryale.AAC.4